MEKNDYLEMTLDVDLITTNIKRLKDVIDDSLFKAVQGHNESYNDDAYDRAYKIIEYTGYIAARIDHRCNLYLQRHGGKEKDLEVIKDEENVNNGVTNEQIDKQMKNISEEKI